VKPTSQWVRVVFRRILLKTIVDSREDFTFFAPDTFNSAQRFETFWGGGGVVGILDSVSKTSTEFLSDFEGLFLNYRNLTIINPNEIICLLGF
jgi:hypothetical protein